jgi:hypothetical protein
MNCTSPYTATSKVLITDKSPNLQPENVIKSCLVGATERWKVSMEQWLCDDLQGKTDVTRRKTWCESIASFT